MIRARLTRFVVPSIHIASVLLALGLLLFTAPHRAHAQQDSTDTQLQANIRSALIADPRSAGLPPEQLNAMVQALSNQAESQGLSASDIAWKPGAQAPGLDRSATVATPNCLYGADGVLCKLTQTYGLDTGDNTIPLLLGLLSGILIIIIGTLLEIRHKAHLHAMQMMNTRPAAMPSAPTPTLAPVAPPVMTKVMPVPAASAAVVPPPPAPRARASRAKPKVQV